MIRASAKIPKVLPRAVSVQKRGIKVSNVLKSADVSSSSPKKGGIFKKLLALTLVSGGGIVGYSWYDKEFRKMLEDNVPYSKEVFSSLFESLPSKEEVSKMISGSEEAKTTLLIKKEEPTPLNPDIEKALQRQAEALRAKVAGVVEAAKSATEVTRLHSKKLKEALKTTEGKEGEWDEVTASQDNRVHATNACHNLETKAREELKKLCDEVTRLRNEKVLKGNKVLSSVSGEAERMNKEMNNAIKQFSKAQSEAKVFTEYKDLVKKGRERFKKELEAIMPTTKTIPLSFSKMTEEELNALIGHAHKRIDQLQNRLAEQEALEEVRITAAVDRQKEEDITLNLLSINMEKQSWEQDIQMLKANWEVEAHIGFEEDLKQQMIRQAAAHNEHINDVMNSQRRELEAKFSLLLSEHRQLERRQFQKEVATWVARMEGIEDAIEKRAEFEKQSHQVQRLWLACEALQTAISSGNVTGSTWHGRLKPLGPEVQLIKQSFPEQPAIRAILDSMPEVALHRGVWTESGLMERFKRVDKVCRQVAMVDETAGVNGSIFRYFLSSFQAKLMVPGVSKIYENPDEEVDVKELHNVFFLLDNAQACLDRGDLPQAVRFVNQLNGEPRRAISDWLNEARLLLETKQLSTALLASASAAGFSSLTATT